MKRKLYIAEGKVDYEPGNIFGVFSTREKANSIIGSVMSTDSFEVTEIEIDMVYPTSIDFQNDAQRPTFKI